MFVANSLSKNHQVGFIVQIKTPGIKIRAANNSGFIINYRGF